ncbi:dynein axonemal assembly factor 8-like [Saccoglossus kowalevskii]|uniref:Uncharacterized protein LOC100371374 n=1 Tax=Saccoglossus kowalevskii TaxID=10224 RepID=A0ABM0GVL2_SACKO|nr:PREDICTED: uncharacterized protein LOC100371374 [Saccoglossus kowalevskii]
MSGNNHTMEFVSLPEGTGLKPQLDSIFAEVQANLPSIDFELSDASSDEEVSIFSRSLKGDLDMQDGDGVTWDSQKEQNDICDGFEYMQSWNHHNDGEVKEKMKSKGVGTEQMHVVDEDKDVVSEEEEVEQEKDSCQDEIIFTNKSSQEAKIKENHSNSTWYCTYLPSEAPKLSLQGLGNVDLDVLLEEIKQEKGSSETIEGSKESTMMSTNVDNFSPKEDYKKDSESLMDKLTQLCIQQSGGTLTQDQLQPQHHYVRTIKEAWTEDTKKPTDSGDATPTQSVLQTTPDTVIPDAHTQNEERETVYLDLRNFGKTNSEQSPGVDAIQRILGIQQEGDDVSDDSDDDHNDAILWHEQRKQIRDRIVQGQVPPPEMWAARRPAANYKPTRKVTKTRTSELLAKQQKEREMEPEESRPEDKIVVTTSTLELKSPLSAPTELKKEEEKKERIEAAKKLREQREQERQTRLRLQRQLETLRPRCSASGKNTSADCTPIVFDMESSYEPSPETLPSILKKEQECLLLTIHMSSNGAVIAHRGSGNKSIDSNTSISSTHATLITWLLSLVPDNYDFLQHEVLSVKPEISEVAPFYVIGLQQLWQENYLSLVVAITPRDKSKIKNIPAKKKSRLRDEIKDISPFQHSVMKYLTTHTLHTVCPWLQGIFACEVSAKGELKAAALDNSGVQSDGSYITSLPVVTSKPLSTFIAISPYTQAMWKIFNAPVGFFWQTVDSDENILDQDVCNDYNSNPAVQMTMSLIYKHIYRTPDAMMGIMQRVLQEGLDLAGIRLLYPTGNLIPSMHAIPRKEDTSNDLDMLNNVGGIIALALRGHCARSKWLDAVGPSDPQLARRTDPNSLCAKYGGQSRDESWLFCPRNPARINSELSRWFGGRVPSSGSIDVGVTNPVVSAKAKKTARTQSPSRRKSKKGNVSEDQLMCLPNRRPPATLTATTQGDIFLTVSPLIPTHCIGTIITVCHNRGFQLRGIRRMRLSVKRANSIGIVGSQLYAFCPVAFHEPVTPKNLDDAIYEQLHNGSSGSYRPPRPATILLLRKENAAYLMSSLNEALMVTFSLMGLLSEIQSSYDERIQCHHCFHSTPYTDSLLQIFGGDFSRTPHEESRTIMPSSGHFYSNAELEQIVVITLTGVQVMTDIGNTLRRILSVTDKGSTADTADWFELLGIKWLPSLSTVQAKEITPFEVGDKQWHPSIKTLMSSPALVCVLRGINAFHKLQSLLSIPRTYSSFSGNPLNVLMSPSAEVAYRQTVMFFHDKECYADPTMRPNLCYLPPVRSGHLVTPGTPGSPTDLWNDDMSLSKVPKKRRKRKSPEVVYIEESIFGTMLSGARMLTTVAVIKPDALRKHLGKILKRICQEGFNVVGMRLDLLTEDEAKLLIPKSDLPNEVLCKMHCDYLTSGAVLILCLQRENAVKKLLDLMGPSNPQEAKKMNQFLWRSLFGVDPINNGLYVTHIILQIMCPAHDPIVDDGMNSQHKFEIKSSTECVNGSSMNGEDTSPTTTRSMGTSTTKSHLLPILSKLSQTNCLVFMSQLLLSTSKTRKGYVQIIDGMLSMGFDIVGLRMVWLTLQQAQYLLKISSLTNPHMAEVLCQGACIVMAVQRDNAITCFDSLLDSPYQGDSLLKKYGKLIIRPKDSIQATKFLELFFDKLMPHCQGQITYTH